MDLAACYAGASPCFPQVVLGQQSGTDRSACNGDSGFQRYPTRAAAGGGSLCGIPEGTRSILENKSFVTMAADAQGNLYVPDAYNNRVLKYLSPFTSDAVADEVWGQSDFSGNLCNRGASAPTASTLCFTVDTFSTGGVELDPAGNLWVADRGNNRVLRFPKNPVTGVIAKNADRVLGQPDFVSRSSGPGLAALWSPASLRFRASGSLYVADAENNRVLVFNPNPDFSNGMAAASSFGSQLSYPFGLEMDPAGEGVWINDFGNHMVELWDWDGSTVRKVLGKDTYQPDGQCVQWLCDSGGGIGIDAAGNILPSIYVYVQDVVRFSAPIPTPQAGVFYQPDKRLFNPPDGYNKRGLKGLRSGAGVATSGDQLLVSDAGRVLFWNGLNTLTSGKPADGFVGNPQFEYQPDCCAYLKADAAVPAARLWVQRSNGVAVYQLPLASGQAPLTTILTSGPLPVLGGGTLTIGSIGGLVPSAQGDFLWVSDTFSHRVLRVRGPLGQSPVVDVVLGQTDISGNQCNRGLVPPPNSGTSQVATADMLCHPGALSFDRLGNLYVSDHGPEVEGNWRLLRFAAGLFPTNNAAPLFAVPASKLFPYRGGQPAITFEPAFDSANRMVVGYNSYLGGNFVGVYNDPGGPDTDPDTYLNDYASWPTAVAFDANDNLYIGDANRSRLLIYRRPFGATILTNQVPATNTNTGGHEIGTRFTSSQNGTIVALRFWKAPADSGTHTGRVWSDTGALLASVVFTGETASGWQEQALSAPLAITAGVNYRVSYNVNTGYSYTSGGLSSSISNPPLTAVSGCYNQVGGNFPNNLIGNDYFADIRFLPSPGSVTMLTTQTPVTNTNTGGHEIGTQFKSSQSGTITALRFWKAPADSGTHTGRVWSDTGTLLASVVFTGETASGWQEQVLSSPLAITSGANYRVSYNVNTGYSYTGGGLSSPITNPPLTAVSGCYNIAGGNFPGNLIGNDYFADVRFQPSVASVTVLTTQTPVTNNNTGGHEIGMRLTSSQNGTIVALRFWKAPADSGTHTGRVWSDTGALLASVVFTGETASGWQEQALSAPLAITAGVNYRVSYNVNTGYSYTSGGLSSSISNPPLTAVSGCYNQVGGNFPNNLTGNNYFADVRFQ